MLSIPPPPEEDDGESSSCDTVFTWAPNRLAFTWDGHPYNSVNGDVTRSFDTSSVITITTDAGCYGILRAAVPGALNPESFSFAISFVDLVYGTPVAGPCFISSPSSTYVNATCFAIVVDWATGNTTLAKWENAALSSLNTATIIYQAAFLPTNGDYFYLASVQDPFENTLTAKIYAEGDFGGTVKWGSDFSHVITNVSDAGLVAIGGQGSNGRCQFGHSTNTAFHSDVTMFGYNDLDTSDP